MSDVKNMITMGIGASPGDNHFWLLSGLDINPSTLVGLVEWTFNARALAWTVEARGDWTLNDRSTAWTVDEK